MELMTISNLSKTYDISTRTLRYYEQIGLLTSTKMDGYAYRTYDEEAIRKLQQILVLRKLRIKLNDIAVILNNTDIIAIIEIIKESHKDINNEISALSIIQKVYEELLEHLEHSKMLQSGKPIFELDILIEAVKNLPISKQKLKEEKTTMEDLNKASETIDKLQDKDVRIVYIPSFTVASSHYIGECPEDNAGKIMNEFVREYQLEQKKEDIRLLGFNNPSPRTPEEVYGYEYWITIPEDLKVPAPIVKKQFQGGLYAAHSIKMGDFHEWKLLGEWVYENVEYEYDRREPYGMDGLLEEHLNAYTYYRTESENAKFTQIDLLMPVKLSSEK
jgi:DNA-binding transcriptional MerR regulator